MRRGQVSRGFFKSPGFTTEFDFYEQTPGKPDISRPSQSIEVEPPGVESETRYARLLRYQKQSSSSELKVDGTVTEPVWTFGMIRFSAASYTWAKPNDQYWIKKRSKEGYSFNGGERIRKHFS